ncbi:MAG: macro domain-containing protein [Candidatus Limnocylindrales bacterium]
MSAIRLWNGDICDLEVDAIVIPATTALWMTSGPGAAIKQRGGHAIEFEAVTRGPRPIGSVVATGAGSLSCRYVMHAVTLGPDRRTSVAAIDEATRESLRLASRLGLRSIALPALGSPLGGVPLPVAAATELRAIRETLPACGGLHEVVVALRSPRTYEVFRAAWQPEETLEAHPVQAGPREDLSGVAGPVAARPDPGAPARPPRQPGGDRSRPLRAVPVVPGAERGPIGVMAREAGAGAAGRRPEPGVERRVDRD